MPVRDAAIVADQLEQALAFGFTADQLTRAGWRYRYEANSSGSGQDVWHVQLPLTVADLRRKLQGIADLLEA
ncbi:hypothetical protein GCM10010156_49690 [Planobispora rosea]|uniref:Uncharacterized protein n=1 Tax=Planobispora rosea TaxID=35762 RepID=A0A8J3WEK0_PLARO|nr:hypothetical protein [Planobispora rosea]GGS85142.1 hypothetical protein GCM10010156_49690 [Planobispora rosea]GIH86480.1 hypothetical protein Pro02_48880 [Planobispora rosea]